MTLSLIHIFRIRNGKACVIYDKCIACGECVRICPSNAKIPSYDKFDIVNNYKYKVALIAPSFYGQFDDIKDINYILTAFRNIGFDFVYEVGIGCLLYTSGNNFVSAGQATEKVKFCLKSMGINAYDIRRIA